MEGCSKAKILTRYTPVGLHPTQGGGVIQSTFPRISPQISAYWSFPAFSRIISPFSSKFDRTFFFSAFEVDEVRNLSAGFPTIPHDHIFSPLTYFLNFDSSKFCIAC